MTKRRNIALLILFAMVVGGLGLYLLRPREPVYQGKPLSVWLETYDGSVNGADWQQANEAFRQMGTNSLPFLVAVVDARDSPIKRNLIRFAERHHWLDGQQAIQLEGTSAWFRSQRAVYAFEALGATAKPAIPALTQLLKRRESSHRAAEALARIGLESVWPLADALTNPDQSVRSDAAFALRDHGPFSGSYGEYPDLIAFGKVEPGAEPDFQKLIKCLKDSDPFVRREAAVCLAFFSKFHREPPEVIPTLIELLHEKGSSTDNWEVRWALCRALVYFGDQAKAAVPELLKVLPEWVRDDEAQTGDIRFVSARFATNALLRLDPEAAAKAGMKESAHPD